MIILGVISYILIIVMIVGYILVKRWGDKKEENYGNFQDENNQNTKGNDTLNV